MAGPATIVPARVPQRNTPVAGAVRAVAARSGDHGPETA